MDNNRPQQRVLVDPRSARTAPVTLDVSLLSPREREQHYRELERQRLSQKPKKVPQSEVQNLQRKFTQTQELIKKLKKKVESLLTEIETLEFHQKQRLQRIEQLQKLTRE